MKKILILISIFALTISCTMAQKTTFSQEALSENLIAKDSSKTNLQNILDQHKGKTLVIEIWASWCSDCVKAMPKIKELQDNNPEIDYIFISMDKTYSKWLAGIEQHQLKGAHYLATDGMKGKFGKAINLDWIPRYLIIDKDGKIITYRAIETDFETINTTLKTLK